MKIKDAIAWADEVKPNAFTERVKFEWLNALEGKIAADLFLLAPAEIPGRSTTTTRTTWRRNCCRPAPRRHIHPVSPGQDRRGQRRVQQVQQHYADLQRVLRYLPALVLRTV